jgi:hypothetical protein
MLEASTKGVKMLVQLDAKNVKTSTIWQKIAILTKNFDFRCILESSNQV